MNASAVRTTASVRSFGLRNEFRAVGNHNQSTALRLPKKPTVEIAFEKMNRCPQFRKFLVACLCGEILVCVWVAVVRSLWEVHVEIIIRGLKVSRERCRELLVLPRSPRFPFRPAAERRTVGLQESLDLDGPDTKSTYSQCSFIFSPPPQNIHYFPTTSKFPFSP